MLLWHKFCFFTVRGISMKKRSTIDAGFTLIELLIVVAIIAILAAIAIPQFSLYRQKGYNAASVSDLRSAKSVLESYLTETQHYPF